MIFQTQAQVQGAGGLNNTLATILNIGPGVSGVVSLISTRVPAATKVRVVVTIDGTAVIDHTSADAVSGTWRPVRLWYKTDNVEYPYPGETVAGTAAEATRQQQQEKVLLFFGTTLKIEACSDDGNAPDVYVTYSRAAA